MKFVVKIIYRDDTEKLFDCFEPPYDGAKYLTLYLWGGKRKMIPQEVIKEVEYWYKKL